MANSEVLDVLDTIEAALNRWRDDTWMGGPIPSELAAIDAALSWVRQQRETAAGQRQPSLNNVPLYTNERIDDIVDNHIFLDNGTATYRVWEDRANKYLREMRDTYEKEIAFWQRYGVVKNLELIEARDAPAPPAPAGQQAMGAMPSPDWSQAPKWASWWAIDDHKRAWWFARKPQQDSQDWVNNGKAEYIGQVYPDWRETLQHRPGETTE